MTIKMWKIKDDITNFLLKKRLWFLIKFSPKKFKGVINKKQKDGWDMTFNDEFSKGKLDEEKWIDYAYYGLRYHPGNITERGIAPYDYYTKESIEFTESSMIQKINKDPKDLHYVDWDGKDWGNWTIPYRNGHIDSSRNFEQKYGYFEIRSRVSSEPGGWPAFWMYSQHQGTTEIDIYEMYTSRRGNKIFESNIHWEGKSGDHKSDAKKHKSNSVSDYHLYAVDWSEKGFKVYYDNILVRVLSNPEAIEHFKYPMHIIISVGPEPQRVGQSEDFPTHEVDYVRAYKKK